MAYQRFYCEIKKKFSLFLSALLIIHVLFLSIESIPENPLKQRFYNKFSTPYVTGLFKQNWSFFAPIPQTSNEIRFECSVDRMNWSNTFELLEGYLNISYSNPLSGVERVSLMIKDIIDEISQDLVSGRALSTRKNRILKILFQEKCSEYKYVRSRLIFNKVVSFSLREKFRGGILKGIEMTEVNLGEWELNHTAVKKWSKR